MTIEKIYKLAQRKFKNLDIDDMDEPCLYIIDNISQNHHFVAMFRLNPSSYDKILTDPSFIVFGGDSGGGIYYEKLFYAWYDAKDYFYDLVERIMLK